MQKVELMSPAGNWESLMAGIKAGANSVYFGVKELNMRSHGANNFELRDLKKIVKICNESNVKTYLTLNTIVYDNEINLIKKICDKAKENGIKCIIASDLSVISYCNLIKMPVNISTQLNVSNIEEIKFLSKYADVITLARELSLDQIKKIIDQIKKEKIKGPSKKIIQIEVFVHGALCVSISGKCYMSLFAYNKSANRGECLQNCRRTYKVIDKETNNKLEIDNQYVMSPKDLCTIGMIDKLINAGISIFKIEGRARAPEYVYTVTKVYGQAIESVKNKTYSKDLITKFEKELKTVFNRGFWKNGYYLGKKLEEWAESYGSKATMKKTFIGVVLNYFDKKKIGYFEIQTNTIKIGDEILITGNTTGVVKEKVESMVIEGNSIKKAKKGDLITIPIKEKIRENDKVYVLEKAS